jgi:hypothetical protein
MGNSDLLVIAPSPLVVLVRIIMGTVLILSLIRIAHVSQLSTLWRCPASLWHLTYYWCVEEFLNPDAYRAFPPTNPNADSADCRLWV